jgi:hypothetical protein
MIRQAFEEESMNRTWVFEWHVQTPKNEKGETVKRKSVMIIFFDIKGSVHKEFVLVGQTINSAYYCHVLW